MTRLVLVIHNVRSALNVGSMMRTAEGFSVATVYMTGYTPYPEAPNDTRLPHQRKKIARQIHKTALGAETYLEWHHEASIDNCIAKLKANNFKLAALEQADNAITLNEIVHAGNLALIVGNEINGLEKSVLKKVDQVIQIPMAGRKESFNVAIAAGIALYHFRYGSPRQK